VKTCLLAVALLSAPVAAATPWSQLPTDRFVLHGRLDATKMKAIACDVEQAVRAMRVPGASTGAAIPLVVAVDSARDAYEFLPQFWERHGSRPLGAYWSGLYGHHILVRVDAPPDERKRRIFHEYAHFATHQAHPNPPRWLDEGLAELWEHAAGEGAIELGRPVGKHLKELRPGKNWIPVATLLSTASVPATGGNARVRLFYAQSWVLAHYLVFEKLGGQVDLARMDAQELMPSDAELKRYVTRLSDGWARTPLRLEEAAACSITASPQSTSGLDALINRARALADGERPEAARPLLLEALRHAPDDAKALETLGFVHFVGNNPGEAAKVFDRLIAAGRGTHVAYYYRALLAGPVPALTDRSGMVSEVEYLEKALSLNPGFGPARDRLREILRKK
jgi:hypothetical protein